MKLTTIIVDDEPEARQGVALLLAGDPEVEIAAVCANGLEAISAINELASDLLFLDVQMPQVDGFEVLRSLSADVHPAVIFTTAYEEYTLKAFEVHAIDYLLKPFTDERFYQALAYAKQLIRAQQPADLQPLLSTQRPTDPDHDTLLPPSEIGKLLVKSDGRIHFVPYEAIIWVEAYDYYVKVHVRNRYFLLRDSLKHLEQRLPSEQFARIHKSSIVNRRYVEALLPQEHGSEYVVVLSNGITLRSSRSYREGVKRLANG
jgi:two-component system LytT family response regulator